MHALKQRVSEDLRNQVIDLRRRHSLRAVATMTGLPLGTVKTLVSRSGAFRDNDQHRALFTLPTIRVSASTAPAVQVLPSQQRVTGDKEVDALLWLRSVIATGQPGPIATALEAAKKIKTPLKELEGRYTAFLRLTNPDNPFATFSSIGFADLEALASKSVRDQALRVEGAARFGDSLFANTDAEVFCIKAMDGLQRRGSMLDYDKDEVATRFHARPDLMPRTLTDCLCELKYWSHLYWLRNVVDIYGSDGPPESTARDWFVFGLLAEIRPRDKTEALAVFRYLVASERDGMAESESILCNLIG
ncbi:MAG TPA: hypothetical protein VF671_13340 [Pseudomonas sp.]|uniref:hypothetical protein n=1 Tax=Pseudomonas sp. TaxID=306 RepID=UPI002EDAC3B7